MNQPDHNLQLASDFIDSGRPKEAQILLARVLEQYPAHGFAMALLGLAYVGMSEYDKAEQAAIQALNADPALKVPHDVLGIVFANRDNDGERSRKAFERAVECEPENVWSLYNLAVTYTMGSQTDLVKGMEFIDKALAIDPEYESALLMKGRIWEAWGKTKEAKKLYEDLVKINPNYSPAHETLGKVNLFEGNFEVARRHVDASLAIDPGSEETQKLYWDLETSRLKGLKGIFQFRMGWEAIPRAAWWFALFLLGGCLILIKGIFGAADVAFLAGLADGINLVLITYTLGVFGLFPVARYLLRRKREKGLSLRLNSHEAYMNTSFFLATLALGYWISREGLFDNVMGLHLAVALAIPTSPFSLYMVETGRKKMRRIWLGAALLFYVMGGVLVLNEGANLGLPWWFAYGLYFLFAPYFIVLISVSDIREPDS